MGGLIHVDIEWSGGRRKSGKERKNEMGGSELGGVRENKRGKRKKEIEKGETDRDGVAAGSPEMGKPDGDGNGVLGVRRQQGAWEGERMREMRAERGGLLLCWSE
ncbi:hypothetical protein MRB53_030906 [Persea americana]|uniref:Uncharacterized protein n=1 Tax=Persea americana TaxID=3435 RepID=A0ACC2KMM9_PERAE|nr:hypothetical protein MRB53_030906 [Persea americana]